MTRFRPCIDLHQGRVKQIVGGSLRDEGPGPQINHESRHDAAWFAARYRADDCRGGHVIQLGPGNEAAARAALATWPGGLQIGGGITAANARDWLDAGAAQVIITSWLIPEERVDRQRLRALTQLLTPQELVIDLSCRRRGTDWYVATQRWQHVTEERLGPDLLHELATACGEFLIHAADVEGLCRGIDRELVTALAAWSPIPVTYAGGGRSIEDLALVAELSEGRVDCTLGSALDIFGGSGARYQDCLTWNRVHGTGPGRGADDAS